MIPNKVALAHAVERDRERFSDAYAELESWLSKDGDRGEIVEKYATYIAYGANEWELEYLRALVARPDGSGVRFWSATCTQWTQSYGPRPLTQCRRYTGTHRFVGPRTVIVAV